VPGELGGARVMSRGKENSEGGEKPTLKNVRERGKGGGMIEGRDLEEIRLGGGDLHRDRPKKGGGGRMFDRGEIGGTG